MKKLMLFILTISLCACGINSTAKKSVENYLNSYINLSDEVLKDLDKVTEEQTLTDSQKQVYKQAIKRQYQDLKYEIINETYNGDEAQVSVKIEVYDLYLTQKNASEYLKKNISKFNNEKGIYDNNNYIDYKINLMKNAKERVTYNIEFNLIKNGETWIISEIPKTDLEKIHGIYNYESENSN